MNKKIKLRENAINLSRLSIIFVIVQFSILLAISAVAVDVTKTFPKATIIS